MRQLGEWIRRLAALLRPRRLEQDMDEELAFHLSMREAEHRNAGAAAGEAARKARLEFGNLGITKDRTRDAWVPPWLQDAVMDVRFACRLLLKDRRFAFAAIITLALGIGANTTAFTFVNGAILRPIPIPNVNRLVTLRTVDLKKRMLGVSFADQRSWRASVRSLDRVVLSFDFAMNITEEGIPAERYTGSYVSIDTFETVGVAPFLGRTFAVEDDRQEAPRTALIAHSVWTTRYGSDRTIVGRQVRINDVPATIVGVMPEGFHFPVSAEVWMPPAFVMGPPATIDARRANRNILSTAYGRLAPGATLAQAQAEANAVSEALAREYPTSNAGISIGLDPLTNLYRDGGLQQMLLLVMGGVVFVLLIACVNVANLLLARAATRAREIAIRASLGATRGRIVRQLFIESAMLAIIAGAVGLAFSVYGVRFFANAFTATLDGPPPFWLDFSIDTPTYVFLAVACVGTTIMFGLAPALYVSRVNPNASLQDGGRTATGGRRARRWTTLHVVVQLALTLMLLTGAALMVRSFVAIYRAGQVVDSSNVVTMRLALSSQKYRTPELIKDFFQRLDVRLASVPEFISTTVASDIPLMTMTNGQRLLSIENRPGLTDTPMVAYLYIGPRYFETFKLRLVRGREFTDEDGLPGQEGAIVNQRFASMFFPDVDPLGERIRLVNAAAPDVPVPWLTIVGVSPTIPQFVGAEAPEPVVYSTVRGEVAPHRLASVIVRAPGDMAATVKRLREELRHVDPDQPGYAVQTLDEVLARTRWPYRVFGSLLALLGGIALVMASVGLFATTAHGVAQCTQEIGVRMALGAQRTEVVWMFVKRTLIQIVAGLGLGLAGAVVVGRLISGFLFRTAPTDPMAIAAGGILLALVALVACVLPARRAARVDPVIALRRD